MAQGLSIKNVTFKTFNEAETWLDDNCYKYGPAIAVKVGNFNDMFPKSVSDKKLFQTYNTLNLSIDNWNTDIISRVKKAKSLQKTCTKCFSKISVSFIKNNWCPVCNSHDLLETDTDKKKIVTMKKKLENLKAEINTAKTNQSKKNKPSFWYVGALCAS